MLVLRIFSYVFFFSQDIGKKIVIYDVACTSELINNFLGDIIFVPPSILNMLQIYRSVIQFFIIFSTDIFVIFA